MISKLWAVIIALPEIAFGLTLFLGIIQVADGQLSAGALVAFFGVALGLRWPIDSIGWLLAMSNDAASATQRYFEVMDAPITVTSPEQPGDRRPTPRGRAGVPRRAVPVRRHPVDDATTCCAASTWTLRAGRDGGPGRRDRIRQDDADRAGQPAVRRHRRFDHGWTASTSATWTWPTCAARVAVAFEEPTLFSASVRENVLLGRPDGTDDEVLRALAVAQADFVLDLPWGLDTRIGEQGLSLSGGQRQRLALARAVVGRPAVLVLDDPLSALDIHTEAQVERALRSVLAQTTALVVAHRASTVQLADRVALLVDGRITAVGTHSAADGRPSPAYRDLLASRADTTSVRAGRSQRPGRCRHDRLRDDTPVILEPEADDAWRGVAAEDTDGHLRLPSASNCRPGHVGCWGR